MDNRALNLAYKSALKDGYIGTIENFKVLLSTNQKALDRSFELAEKGGYKDGQLKFKNLVQGKINHATVGDLRDYRWHSAEGDITETLTNIYKPQGFTIEHATGGQDAITIKNTETGETSEPFIIPSGFTDVVQKLGRAPGVTGVGRPGFDTAFTRLHKDITSWIEGSRGKEITKEGELLKKQNEMSPHSTKTALDISSNEVTESYEDVARDVFRGDDGSIKYQRQEGETTFDLGAGRLKGKKTKLTTKEIVDLTTDITEQTSLLFQDLDNIEHGAGMELEILGGVREWKAMGEGRKFTQLQGEERTRIGQAILTTINKQRKKDGKGLISWRNFNKIFGDKEGNLGVLDTVIGKMSDEQGKRVALSGLDPNNADPKLVEQENNKIKATKTEAQQYKIDRMDEIQTLTGEIKKLNTSLRTAPSEKQDSIRKQISDKLGQIENKYYEITAKGAESGDNSLDGYFTKREEDNGVVYTEDRKDFMNQIFKETKLSIEEFILQEQAKYDNSITKREALQNLLQSGYLEKQNLIQSSQNQFVTVNVNDILKNLKHWKGDANPVKEFIRKARLVGGVNEDGDARISVAKMYEFGLGGNEFDNWWDPMKGATLGKMEKNVAISDEDVEMLKHFKREIDTVDAKNLALYDLGVLDQDPESVDDIYDGTGGWLLQVGNSAAKATLTKFGVSEHDADNIVSTGKEHTNRFMLDQYKQVARNHNNIYKSEIEKGEVEVLEFTDEQVGAMTRSMSDNVAEGVGHFIPVLAELGAITVATQGLGTLAMAIPMVSRVVRGFEALRKGKGAWSVYANAQYHFGRLALEESKMQLAGFKPGSGSAFYLGGLSTSGIRMGGRFKWMDPLFQKVFKAPIVGMGSMELAGITELGWEHLKGEVDFKREMVDLYGDMDDVEQRLITNAIVFGIMGAPKIKGVRSEGKWYDPTSWRAGTDFMSTQAKGRVLAKMRGKMNDILVENGAKVDKAGNIINREKWVKKLKGKELDKYNSYQNTVKDLANFYVAESYHRDLNVETKKGQEAFKRRIVDPINDMIGAFNKEHGGIAVKFTKDRSEFSQVNKDGRMVDGKATAEYIEGKKGQSDTILIDPTKFTSGKMTHEVTHALLKVAFTNNNKYHNFVSKLKEVFSDHGFIVAYDKDNNPIFRTSAQMEAKIKEKGSIAGEKLDYRNPKEKEIGNEEFLAYMAEFLTAPEMYTQYAAPNFLKEIKTEVQDILQNTFGYNAKITDPQDLVTVFAGFGRAIRQGDKRSIKSKSKQIANYFKNEMNFLGVEAKVAQQGGSKKVKRKSAELFEAEQTKTEAKEKKERLQEELKQIQDKFIKDKEGKDPKEVAVIREKFQEAQRVIRDEIVDQNAIISGKRDYAKEISNFRDKNKDPKARNKFIAKLNAEVSEQMAEVRGIENVQRFWNERNALMKQRDVTYPEQLRRGSISRREYENKLSDVNNRLAEINKSIDWKTWSKLAGDLMIINAGKIENVAKTAYGLGADYGTGRIGKSELKTALDAQFLEVIADYKFATPGQAEFGAYMNIALPTKIGAAYKMETEGGKPKWAKRVGVEKAENIVDTGAPIGESNFKTKVPKKEKVKVTKKEKELNSVLKLETEGGKALEKIKVDPVAKTEINKKLKPEGIVNSESMYEAALNRYKKELKPDGKRRYNDKQAEELAKTTTWDNVNSAVVQDLAPEVTNAMIGITPKKGNITPGSIKNGQDFVDANAGEILKIMKWNSAVTPGKGIPERMVATSMNLPKKWLDTFYHEPSITELKELGFRVSEKTGRVETPAGPRPKVLNKNITVEQLKEFVGIKPDGTRIVDRNLSSTIKGLPVILGKAVTNQLTRKALENGSVELGIEYNVKDVVNRMKNGVPPRLASHDLFAGVGSKFGITPEQAQKNLVAWVYGDTKGIPKEQLEFLEKLNKDAPEFKDAVMELHEHIVDAYKTTHVVTSATGAVARHTGNTILTPEYKAGIESIAKSLSIPKEKYNELLTEAAKKTTTGIFSTHTDKVTGEKIKVMDREAVTLINKFAGEYVKLLPKEIGVTLAMNLSGSPLGGRTGKGTFVKAFSKHFNMVEMYKKQGMKTKEAEKQAQKDAGEIVTKWEKGEKIKNEQHKEYLDNVEGKTGLYYVKNKGKKNETVVELNYKDPLLTNFRTNIEKNLGKNTHEAFKGIDVSELKTGSQLANAYKKAREFAEQGDMLAAEAALAKAFTALDMKTKEGMYQATGAAMEQLILNAEKGNSKDISKRLQFVFKIAKNNTSLTEGERVFTSNRFVRMVEGEGTSSRDPMIKDLMKEGLSLEKATEKVKGKVEHSKTSLNASYEKAFAVVSGRWGAEGQKIARDYIGIFSSVGKLDVIDRLGTRTSAARLSRMAKDRSELKNYKEFIDGKFTGRTLEDVLMEQVTKDLQALGAKVSIRSVKENYLTDAVNNYIAEPTSASVRNVKQTIKNKESVKKTAANNRNIAKKAGIPISKNATNSQVLASMNIFEGARSEGRKKDKKRKGMSAWDFDDTLARTKSGVRYTLPNPSGKPAPQKKVIFMAGGPGAGKSTVIKGLGLEKQGFKIVNQDISLQWLAKNHGLPKDMRDFTPEQASKWGELSWDARMIAKHKQAKYQGRGDGIIVDGTGSSFKSMEAQRMEFKRKGYDVHMLFVETSKDVAVARNRARKERSLKTSIVERTWDNVMKNKDRFQKPDVFGKNFTLIKTDKLKQTDPIPADVVGKMDAFTKGYKKGRLDPGEYADKGEMLEAKGAKFDFTEFDYVKEGERGPLFGEAMERAKKFGTKDQFVITARPHAAQMPIFRFLDAQGLKIPFKNIITLENSSAEAKAMFMLGKFKEGYNDMYFADDAMQNVKAVKNVLEQLDIKSDVQQAKRASKDLFNEEFNRIIEETTGFKAGYEVGTAKARMLGKDKKSQSIILPGAQDFMGLMYNFMGKGKQGEAHKKFFEDNLSKPFSRGWNDMLAHRQTILDDFKRLKKITPEINGNIAKTGNKYRHGASDIAKLKTPSTWKDIPGSKYSYEQAVRTYLWDKSGFDVPGLSKTDAKLLNETVMNDPILKNYADQLGALSKEGKGYIEPGQFWFNETIMSDVYKLTQERGMKKYLAEFIENKNIIFSEANMQKIEATQGKPFREALEDVLWRMEKGTNRPTGNSRETSMFMNWVNGSVGATMNWNMRSAIIQQLSTINFLNWKDNNPLMAAKAFANQPQFWKDYSTIWNSSVMRQRRKGLKINVHESEIADAVSTGGIRGAFNYFLKLGFTPTMLADSHAISFGGATFYRNRLNTYLKEGFSKTEAETQAFKDFQARSEPTQQSSRPDLVSKWQADPILGRLIFPFSNVNTQNARRADKGARDAKNNRGDMKDNLSRVGNYGLLQPLLYGGLSAGLIALFLDEDEDFTEKEKQDKVWRTTNTMLDSQLRGLGYPGAVISAGKNTMLEYHKQSNKPNPDHAYTMLQMTSVSPVVNIKLRNIYSGLQTTKYNKAVIEEMPYWDLDNPHWFAKAQVIQGATNIPTSRFMYKRMNMKEAIDSDNQWWQRAHHVGGWAPWDLGTEIEEIEEYKKLVKEKKKKEKKKKKKKKKTRYLIP